MAVELITKDDLIKFKQDLFSELKQLLQGHNPEQKQLLKSWEVRQMLGISRGTLQNMRSNGTLTATKIGGPMFYAYEDIQKLMQEKKSKRQMPSVVCNHGPTTTLCTPLIVVAATPKSNVMPAIRKLLRRKEQNAKSSRRLLASSQTCNTAFACRQQKNFLFLIAIS